MAFWNDENNSYIVTTKLNAVLRNQSTMLALLSEILQKENKMAIDLTAMTAEVANNTSVTASVEQLVTNLVAQIAAIPPSSDPVTQAALDALTATLSGNDTSIAAAVVANTPAAPPAPASGRR